MVGDRWRAAAALVDRSRRALYDYVRRQDHPVTRDEAAGAQRMSRGLAAFHLDKLVDAGLLHASYQAPPDRPRGRGRAPKVYEPVRAGLAAGAGPGCVGSAGAGPAGAGPAGVGSAGDGRSYEGPPYDGVAITIPERRYRLIAEILADAVADDPAAGRATDAAHHHAYRRGRELGTARHPPGVDHPAADHPGVDLAEADHADLVAVLEELGFEPRPGDDGRLLLDNCPFHALAARQTALVCGLNHAFLTGLVAGLASAGVRPELVPRPGACCVELTPEPPGS